MKDSDKTKEQAIDEIAELRHRISELEASEAGRKRVEEELRKSELEFLRTIYDTANALIVRHDWDFRVVYMNPYACKVLGYEEEEMIGKDIRSMLEKSECDSAERVWQQVTIDPGTQVEGFEQYYLKKGGGSVLISWNVTALRDVDGNPMGILGVGQDITERKRAEEALRESEERYQDLFESMMDGLVVHRLIVDEKGKPVDYILEKVNSAAENILSWKREDIEGKRATEVYSGDTPFIERYAKVPESGKAEYFIDYYPRFGRWYEITCFCPEKGHFANVFRDITERKMAEETLKESRDAYKATFESTGTAMLIAEEDSTISMINAEFEDLCGYSKEEVEGKKSWVEFIVKADLERMKDYQHLRMVDPNAAPPYYELQFADKQGNVKDILITLALIPGTRKNVGSLLDITERKRAEQTLRVSEEKYRTILQNIEEGYYEVDIAGNFTVFNNSMCRILGYPEGELMGMNYRQYMDDENAEKAYQTFDAVYRTGEPAEAFGREVITKEGTRKFVEASVSLIRDSQGEPAGFRGIVRDITERKQGEEQLKAAVREKELLMREVHHRVKNNLQIISSLLDMSSLRTRSQPAQDLIINARSKIHSIALIHSQLYASNRFDQVDMESHVRELVSYLLEIYGGRPEHITTLVEVAAVKLQIDQAVPYAIVLNELISNALQHAFIGREKGTIRVSMERLAAGTILTTVKNDGIGISPEFDIADADTLGLKLVRNVVQKQLKGKVRIKRNKGTEFIVEFKPLEKEVQYA